MNIRSKIKHKKQSDMLFFKWNDSRLLAIIEKEMGEPLEW